ncbi:aspartyl protease family protein At5g10770-like [Nymphaea colorata]|nr:aspartyl protease family protein At5g10770-like [Nymphaea colorata]
MAKASVSSTTCFFLLFLYSLPLFQLTGARRTNLYLRTVEIDALLRPPSRCNAGKAEGLTNGEEGPSAMKLVDRHGPCSPFHGNVRSTSNSQLAILQRDRSRVNWINSRISSSLSPPPNEQPQDLFSTDATVSIPAKPGNELDVGNYIVTVGLGTPKVDFNLIFDTASDLTWVQCEPCSGYCYPQQGTRFVPSASATYKNIACSAQECADVKLESGFNDCKSSNCIYGVAYGDRSYTVGYLSQDTLTLTANDSAAGFIFGCGQNNQGLFGLAGGLLGLGRSKLSAISQTAQKYGSVFAYCLPTSGEVGQLTFGPDSSYSTAKYTPLLHRDRPFYFVSVTGMSVGAQPLPVAPSVFATSGTITDSGTVITRLSPAAYDALRSAFRAAMAKYKMADPLSILDTCYDFSNTTTIEYPYITFHFQGGTDLVLDAFNIFYIASASQICLAFAANSNETDVNIIANIQQRKTLIVHDIPNSRIGFQQNACN